MRGRNHKDTMATIDPVRTSLGAQTANQSSGGSLTNATDGMGKDQFLQLLTAQLQNQDPLDPQKNHEFVAQLAQFSALEQQISVNENLQMMMLSQSSMANGQLSQLIGKEIVAQGDGINIDGGDAQPFNFELANPAAKVEITVYNQAGQAVATHSYTNVKAGFKSLEWPGYGSDGKHLPDGRYRFEVSATDARGNPVSANAMTRGVVSAVTFERGYPELIVGAARVLPGEIIQIVDVPATGASGSSPTPTPSPIPTKSPIYFTPEMATQSAQMVKENRQKLANQLDWLKL